jgi:transcriptional regulator with XRE-family HTH domain
MLNIFSISMWIILAVQEPLAAFILGRVKSQERPLVKGLANEIGGRIRRRREALGLTRAELARRCDISEDALGLIERGACSPRIESLLKLADALRVPTPTLLGGRPPRQGGASLAMDRLIGYLGGRSEPEIRMVHDIARGVLKKRTSRKRQP